MRPLSKRIDLRVVSFDGDEARTLEVLDSLRQDSRVQYAHLAYEARLFEFPNDPYAINDGNPADSNPDQFWLDYGNVYDAWDITKGDPSVVVAVIDSGADLDHPDLEDNIWVNPGETPGNNQDDDGNGYVDDVHGFDWVGQANGSLAHAILCQFQPQSAFCRDGNPDLAPGDPALGDGQDNLNIGQADAGAFHGTHVAGIIGAVINNHVGVAGAAPQVQLMILRVATAEGNISILGLVEAIEYAVDNGADVINMSLGIPADAGVSIPGLEEICQVAIDAGVAVVAATGNGGRQDGSSAGVAAPGSFSSTLAVGSCNTHDARSRYSDFGPEVDLCAYGGEITSTFDAIEEAIWSTGVVSKAAGDAHPDLDPGDPVYIGAVGTSMATPEAAGLAALVKSLNPSLQGAEIYEVMRNGSRDIGAPGFDHQTGFGVIDFEETLSSMSTSTARIAGF